MREGEAQDAFELGVELGGEVQPRGLGEVAPGEVAQHLECVHGERQHAARRDDAPVVDGPAERGRVAVVAGFELLAADEAALELGHIPRIVQQPQLHVAQHALRRHLAVERPERREQQSVGGRVRRGFRQQAVDQLAQVERGGEAVEVALERREALGRLGAGHDVEPVPEG